MAVYERHSGAFVAEREQPEPGSDREAELDRLAADPSTNWRKAEEAKPKRAAAKKPAAKPEEPKGAEA